MAVSIALVIAEDGSLFASIDQNAPEPSDDSSASSGSPSDTAGGSDGPSSDVAAQAGGGASSSGGGDDDDSAGTQTVPMPDLAHFITALKVVYNEVVKSMPPSGGEGSQPAGSGDGNGGTSSGSGPGSSDDDEDSAMQSAYSGGSQSGS